MITTLSSNREGFEAMTYTKKDFGKELLDQISNGYDILKVARWAHNRYMSFGIEVDESVQQIVLQIVAMEEGAEFEMNEIELTDFANKLVNET